MPMLLEGSCHCRKVKYSVESNTPVPYQLCQCSICRKTGGYMGSVNIMGNTATHKITKGEDLLKYYIAPLEFDKDDKPTKKCNSKRAFCSECASMLWVYDDAWAQWIYPFAASIDTDLPVPPKGAQSFSILRASCPDYVPTPEGWKVFPVYPPGEGIEEWHKENGAWID